MKVTVDKALIEQAIDALANVKVTGPDDDGVIWINLPGNGVTGKAILRVGKSGLIAAQCATLFDEQRVGAIAALRAALAEPAVEPVAWRVHPATYGVGHDGVYALTTRTEQVDAWRRKGWDVEPLYTSLPHQPRC